MLKGKYVARILEDDNLESRFMVSSDFGSRLVERLDMMYVRVLVWPAV